MDILNAFPSTIPITESVLYSCVLTNTWSMANHPVDYASISGSAHWTSPVLVSHSNAYEVWAPNTLASPGVERVAEGGVTSVLEDEVRMAQDENTAGDIVVGRDQFNSRDPPQVFEPILVTPNYPLLSTITMAGPSPDWFTGIYNFNPVDLSGQCWWQSFEIATYPWDAGTEMGETYSINNDPEVPHGPIFRLTRDTVPDSGILLDPTGTEVLPVAIWTCSIDNEPISTFGGGRALSKEETDAKSPLSGLRGSRD